MTEPLVPNKSSPVRRPIDHPILHPPSSILLALMVLSLLSLTARRTRPDICTSLQSFQDRQGCPLLETVLSVGIHAILFLFFQSMNHCECIRALWSVMAIPSAVQCHLYFRECIRLQNPDTEPHQQDYIRRISTGVGLLRICQCFCARGR